MLATVIYLCAMTACLYGPTVTGATGLYVELLFGYAGAPWAVASAAQAAVARESVLNAVWRNWLAVLWAVACLLITLPGAELDDPVWRARICGGMLVIISAVYIVSAIPIIARQAGVAVPVRAISAIAPLVFGALFLLSGLRVIASSPGGPIGDSFLQAEWYRGAVMAGAIASVLGYVAGGPVAPHNNALEQTGSAQNGPDGPRSSTQC